MLKIIKQFGGSRVIMLKKTELEILGLKVGDTINIDIKKYDDFKTAKEIEESENAS